jgi:hypothetical protein
MYVVDVQHAFRTLLTWELDGGERSASRPGRFITEKGTPRYPLDSLHRRFERNGEEKKIPAPTGNRTPVVQPVA